MRASNLLRRAWQQVESQPDGRTDTTITSFAYRNPSKIGECISVQREGGVPATSLYSSCCGEGGIERKSPVTSDSCDNCEECRLRITVRPRMHSHETIATRRARVNCSAFSVWSPYEESRSNHETAIVWRKRMPSS